MTIKDINYYAYVPKQNLNKLLEMLKQGEKDAYVAHWQHCSCELNNIFFSNSNP